MYSLLRGLGDYRPVVLAESTMHVDEFPIEPLVELTPRTAPLPARALRRARAIAARMPSAFDHAIVRESRRHGCVALHAHFGEAGWVALPAARRLGIPLVTTFYGYDLALPQSKPEWAPRYEELFTEGTLFVCEGGVMAHTLEGIGAPADRVRVVPIGIDLAKLPFEPRDRREPLVVYQPARFIEKKGIDLSLQAFAAARSELGSAELWLAGDGPLRDELERLAGELGIGEDVRFLGMLSYDEHRATLKRADVAIQPSRTASDGDTEGGAPTILLEFQAVGIPVVATRHADIPEVVAFADELVAEEDVEGLAAALVRCAGLSGAERRDRAERARRYVEGRHDSRRVAAEVERLYDEALDFSS